MQDTTTRGRGYALSPGAGEAHWFLGERITLLAGSAQTGGAFALLEDLAAPGGEPPPHSHSHEDEAFYVLEGALQVTCGDETFTVEPGGFAFLPRRVVHHWVVTSPTPARLLVLFTPGGFEGFFVDGGVPARAMTPPPMDTPPDLPRIMALAAQYGLRVPPPSGGAQ